MKMLLKLIKRSLGIRNLKWWLQDRYYPVKNRIEDMIDGIFHKPIYYYYFSRDCDMCESSRCDVFRKGEKAFQKMQEEALKWAEGPMTWTPISKEDYEQWYSETHGKTSHRDRAMEAYENGRGNSIYV